MLTVSADLRLRCTMCPMMEKPDTPSSPGGSTARRISCGLQLSAVSANTATEKWPLVTPHPLSCSDTGARSRKLVT